LALLFLAAAFFLALVVSWHHFFLLLFDFGFAFGFALSRNAFAVGAPFSPGLRMRSPDPALMRLRLA